MGEKRYSGGYSITPQPTIDERIKDLETQITALKKEKREQIRLENVKKRALKKLTSEEQKALGLL